jgi:hypothetical protein
MEHMTEQILECLLASQEKIMAKMKASYEEMMARLKPKMDSHREKLMMVLQASKEKTRGHEGGLFFDRGLSGEQGDNFRGNEVLSGA